MPSGGDTATMLGRSVCESTTPNCDVMRDNYNYYAIKQLVCHLYQYIFSSNTKKFANVLDLILASFKKHELTHGSYVFKEQDDLLFNYLYKLAFYTRDTLKMFDVTYIQIIIWNEYYPEIAEKIVTEMVTNNRYGCWRDIKHICKMYSQYHNISLKYLTFNTLETYYNRNYKLPSLILHCFSLYKKQLCIDLVAMKAEKPVSNLAKWIPREKSQTFGWIYRHFVVYVGERMDSEKDYCFTQKWLRKEISKLNKHIHTTQINMCDNKWEDIHPEQVTSETYRRNKLALLNINDEGAIRYPSSIDRISCALKINEYMVGKYSNEQGSTKDAVTNNSSFNDLIDNFITRSTYHDNRKLCECIKTNSNQLSALDKQCFQQEFEKQMSNYSCFTVDNVIIAIDLVSTYSYYSANNNNHKVNSSIDRFYTKKLPHVNAISVANRVIRSSSNFSGFITLNNTWEDCRNDTHIETIDKIITKAQPPYDNVTDQNSVQNSTVCNINTCFDVVVYNIYITLYNKITDSPEILHQIREKTLKLSKYTILFMGDRTRYATESYSYLMTIVEKKFRDLGNLLMKDKSEHGCINLLPPKLLFWDTSDGIQDRDASNNSIHYISKVNQYVSIINPRKFSCMSRFIKDNNYWCNNGYANNNLAMAQWSETQRSVIESLFKHGINEMMMFNSFTNFTHAVDKPEYQAVNVFD